MYITRVFDYVIHLLKSLEMFRNNWQYLNLLMFRMRMAKYVKKSHLQSA